MESLFDNINVRDLLSAQDLSDPTSPLSAPDLHLLIQRLESQSLQIRSQVQSYLVSHREDFARLFSLCNDAVSQTREVSDDVAAIIRLLSDRPIDAEVREVVSEMKVKKEELKVKKELLGLVGTVVGLNKRLESVKEALRSGRFEFAAQGLKELKVALRIDEKDDREPLVYGLLRKEWSQCFEEVLLCFLAIFYGLIWCIRLMVILQLNTMMLEVENVNRIQFQTVLEAMEVVSILEYGLAKVADLMIKYVITPFINHGQPLSFLEELHQESAVLKIVASPDIKIRKHFHLTDINLIFIFQCEYLDGEFLYSGILLFIKFIYRSICLQKSSWMQCFGRLTWPRISELIISSFLSKVVPTDASKLPDFQKIIIRTSEFEAALKELMSIQGMVLFGRMMKQVHTVLLHSSSSRDNGINYKNYSVLAKIDFIVKLIFATKIVQDVCLSSTRVALEFYQTARDAILLYEVVVPVKLERQLNCINQVAVLLHNDCLYLSQEILGFAFEYRTDFPSSIKEHAVFVDLAPRFQLLAEEILQRQVHLVIYNLKEAIDGADGFQNTHQMQQFESAKFSIEQVVFILEKIHIIWEPLLLPSTYRKSMCTVLESVFSRIARDILLLDDIAAEETLQLQRLVHLMLENLSSLLESLSPGGQTLQEFPAQSPEDLIPSLRKIRKLSELLDMPLKSITSSWENKELLSCGFTVTEVEDFIKAIFTDSPLRKACLWRIQNASF
ncbi:Centromere/kinetochore protein [Vigna angularis]|uniref:Centromere/kinetochore protein n=1 Tax=Phaseolus angularis TaxID=3914 RepID=A0A8T0K237_PHAAN|nr:Centromere/kinetochore protein [Vigna angularis]